MRASAFAPMTATAHRLVSCSVGCPGNNEAVSVLANSKQHDIKEWPARSKRVGAVELL